MFRAPSSYDSNCTLLLQSMYTTSMVAAAHLQVAIAVVFGVPTGWHEMGPLGDILPSVDHKLASNLTILAWIAWFVDCVNSQIA